MKQGSPRFIRPLSLLIAAIWCGGCVTQGNFPNRVAETQCDWAYRCGESIADIAFGSPQKCVDTIEAEWAKVVDNCEDWNGKEASKCLDSIEERKCVDLSGMSKACKVLAVTCGG